MKFNTYRLLLLSILFLISQYLNAQNGEFNLDNYRFFLETNQNLTTSQLLDMHPSGVFKGDLKLQPENALYFDSISIKYNLTDYEKS